jgi:hypothetical protein
LLVLFTFHLGRIVFGRVQGVIGALLISCSPSVLLNTLATMADVPAAALWTGAFVAALNASWIGGQHGTRVARERASAGWALLAGILTGLAVLTRPNLVPLAVFPWLIAVVRAKRFGHLLIATIWFAIGSVPFALFVAWVNNYLYGSPFSSGYGALSPGFALAFAWTNLARYPIWWWQTQGPLAFLWPFGVGRVSHMRRERFILALFAAAVGLSYVFYLPFDSWMFLRFGLAAMPIAFLFTADLIDWAARGSVQIRTVGLIALTLVMGGHAVRFSRSHAILSSGSGEQRYVVAGLHVLAATSPEVVILTVQHSGSVRYYSGRLTLQWNTLPPTWLDRAVETLNRRGVSVYALLEHWEEPLFREQFQGQNSLLQLDRGPSAIGWHGELRLYPIDQTGDTAPRSPATMLNVPLGWPADISPAFTQPAAIARLR